MAVYNEILVGRYNRFLQKLLGMKGGPPAPALAGDIISTIPFTHDVESLLHQGWDSYGAGQSVSAVAANQSAFRLANPAASNVVAVVTKISLDINPVGHIFLDIGTPGIDLTTFLGNGVRFDARSVRTSSFCRISSQNNLPAPPRPGTGPIAQSGLPTINQTLDLVVDIGQNIPLLPGDSIQVTTQVVNSFLTIAMWWRERFLEETERT